MLKLCKVAVTGGIASGKSTVISFFQKLGAYVVSADQIVHHLLSSNTEVINKVKSLLGDQVFTQGCIERKKVADAVFKDPELLEKLEALLHPLVASIIEERWKEASGNYPLFVAEVPLLFESGQERFYDVTVAVVRPEPQVNERAARQFTQAEKAKRADFIIENTGSLEELEAKVASLYRILSTGEDLDDESRK
ncbi:MAG: dephospho-CoA kinase [Verrucomicrobia bacterium]|nr:dephospho-CoA kinase [Verrucomicrobiota bacterium]